MKNCRKASTVRSIQTRDKHWAKWPFDKRFHLLFNIAVGGNWGGAKGIDDNAFPSRMEIDYVRVYSRTGVEEI